MGKGLILGIDFSKNFTQLAYINEDGIPQSVSIGMEGNFLIPTVACYNEDFKEWSAGEEAINRNKQGKCHLYRDMEDIIQDEALYAFMSYIIKVAINYCGGRPIRNVLISVEDVNPELVEKITDSLVKVGFESKDVRVISHTESFVYYVLNQNRDIWINQVYFLDFNKHSLVCRKLNVIKGRKPYVADVTVEDLSGLLTMEQAKVNPREADEIIASYMEKEVIRNVVSGVFLCGEGFYTDGWDKTLKTICVNRRVFKGNNLIVKGAAYGAKEFFHIPALEDFLISCKGRTRVKITMNVKVKGVEKSVTLSNIGDYWHQAKSAVECIIGKSKEAYFVIHDVMNHRNEEFKIDLDELPDRPEKTTRIRVDFRYLEENKFEITVTDLGFGEFYKAKDVVIKKEITIG